MALLRAIRPLVIETEPPTVDVDTVRKQVVAKLDQLRGKSGNWISCMADLNAQLATFDADIPGYGRGRSSVTISPSSLLKVVAGWVGASRRTTVREVVNGKVGRDAASTDTGYLGTVPDTSIQRLQGAEEDPYRRRQQNWSHDQIYKLFAVRAQAGYQKRVSSFREARGLPSASIWKTGKAERSSPPARRRRKST